MSSSTVPVEGNNFSVLETVLKVADGLVELEALDGACHVVAVLVVGPQISNSAFSG